MKHLFVLFAIISCFIPLLYLSCDSSDMSGPSKTVILERPDDENVDKPTNIQLNDINVICNNPDIRKKLQCFLNYIDPSPQDLSVCIWFNNSVKKADGSLVSQHRCNRAKYRVNLNGITSPKVLNLINVAYSKNGELINYENPAPDQVRDFLMIDGRKCKISSNKFTIGEDGKMRLFDPNTDADKPFVGPSVPGQQFDGKWEDGKFTVITSCVDKELLCSSQEKDGYQDLPSAQAIMNRYPDEYATKVNYQCCSNNENCCHNPSPAYMSFIGKVLVKEPTREYYMYWVQNVGRISLNKPTVFDLKSLQSASENPDPDTDLMDINNIPFKLYEEEYKFDNWCNPIPASTPITTHERNDECELIEN